MMDKSGLGYHKKKEKRIAKKLLGCSHNSTTAALLEDRCREDMHDGEIFLKLSL